MDKLIQIAVNELGQKEVPGTDHNSRIVQYATESGVPGIGDDETPWCSTFVNWVAEKAGLKGTGKANARSWLRAGENVNDRPEPGDVVVFWRESRQSWKGHVGFFFGFSSDGSRVYCLGGNQGNQVSISAFPANTVLGFRRLAPVQRLTLPDVTLKRGATGEPVKQLQHALKLEGYDAGTTDGIFGSKTEAALKELQADSGILHINGEYNVKTKEYLINLLQT